MKFKALKFVVHAFKIKLGILHSALYGLILSLIVLMKFVLIKLILSKFVL